LTRDEQREQTIAQLLQAAAEVFARKGYHAASVDDVDEAAGFTKGAVYSNFESKEALFLALYRQHIERAIEIGAQVLLEAQPEDRGAALAAHRQEMGLWERDWHLLETEFLLYAARNESMRELVDQQHQRTRQQVSKLVQAHLADIGREDANPLAIARIIIAALDGLADAALIEGDDYGDLVGTMIDLITRGLMASGVSTDAAHEGTIDLTGSA
jgi:AcrR family transcriptional regulator